MQDWLTAILISIPIGFGLGIWAGAVMVIKNLSPFLGDQYEINKPKIKGRGNHLLIEQENTDTDVPEKEKKNWFSKIFKRKNNGNK